MFNYASIREIKNLLREHNIAAQKKFGQNFMVPEAARKKFVDLLPVPDIPGQQVWEIGPGIGAISILLLEAGMSVRSFEIDRGFVVVLRELFADAIAEGSFSVVEGDIRKTIPRQPDNRPAAITGNLPYNIAAGLLSLLIRQGFTDIPMVFTLQKEVVERICARPGQQSYGSLSILCQYAMSVENCGTISPACFFPVPEVQSGIIRLMPMGSSAVSEEQTGILEKLLSILFRSRRKTMANNIRQSLDQEGAETILQIMRELDIDPRRRTETLEVEDFRNIINKLKAGKKISAISAP